MDSGFEGIPIPYSPKLDDGITVLLLCCFFMSAYVLSRSRKFLVQLVKDFLLNRERTSIFAATTATDMRYMLLLILQTCVLASVCTFNYFVDVRPELGRRVSPYVLLGAYLALALLYLFWKWVTYSFLGWIFFDASRTRSLDGVIFYSTLLSWIYPFPVCFVPCLLRFKSSGNCDNRFIFGLFY